MRDLEPHPRWDLVIFDCDGVLVDSESIICRTYCEMSSELGWPVSMAEAIQLFKGGTNAGAREIIESHIGYEIADGFDGLYLDRLTKAFESELLAVPGILTVIHELTELGIPYVAVSNGLSAAIAMKLRFAGLSSWFSPDRMISAAELGTPKPHPDAFRIPASQFEANPARVLVIEDSVDGIDGALAAGMHVLALAATKTTDVAALSATGAPVVEDARDILDFVH
jgi:HAD superfamily hydrolase (TIGR01509 family)